MPKKSNCIIYSPKQKKHTVRWEWNFGRRIPYPEKNTRVQRIHKELCQRGYKAYIMEPKLFPLKYITAVHDQDMVKHIKSCENLGEKEAVFPHIFPYSQHGLHPNTDKRKAGYYCFDVGTQIGKYTYAAAKSAADVALHGALLLQKERMRKVFALCRPPGHHADINMYGGYCYFNNVGIAAALLSRSGSVAIIDLDFHHGNGTQNIFYHVPNVFFVSIHGDPRNHYPYFCGFRNEKGDGLGKGYNLNIPLGKGVTDNDYLMVLHHALMKIKRVKPKYLLVSMGFDTFVDDPAGDFCLSSEAFYEIGNKLGMIGLPVLACLEGGYELNALGRNAANFYEGLVQPATPS